MNAIAKIQEQAVAEWFDKNQWAAIRGIDEPTWNALCSTIYPGAKADSVLMAVDYCKARKLDIMLKPVHLVPMQVKDAQTGNKAWRDVPMPGIGMYRIQASRSGDEAGHDEPEFGPTIETEFNGTDWNNNPVKVKVRYPEWCKYTVYKVVGDRLVAYTAKEFWMENYATQSAKSEAPNAMWKKRPFAQLSKCAEAQALRKGWPEIGQQPTAEEMEGKPFEHDMGLAITDRSSGIAAVPGSSQERIAQEKQTISDERLAKAIDRINAGEFTMERLNALFGLTGEQEKAVEEGVKAEVPQ